MNLVFLDTVGLLALWDEADQWHVAAQAAYQLLKASRTRFVTSSYVLLECGNAAARRPYRDEVNALRIKLELGSGVVDPTRLDWQQAWEAYLRRDSAQAGIVDQVSFVIMRRLGVTQAFTNDDHFSAAGFERLF